MTKSDDLHISLPFAKSTETAVTPRYFWKGTDRGDGHFVIIQHTQAGSGGFLLESRIFPVPEGHALIALIPEESAYFYPPDAREPWTFSWLNFYGPLAVRLCRDLRRKFGPVLPLPPRSTAGSAYNALVRQGERRTPTDPLATSLACYSFLLEWARQLEHPTQSDPMETALRLCRSRFHEPLGVKELAAKAGLSREHFTRLFAGHTGLPPARYLRELRAEAAGQMMETGGVPLQEAALRCGFSSPRALSRALAARKA